MLNNGVIWSVTSEHAGIWIILVQEILNDIDIAPLRYF